MLSVAVKVLEVILYTYCMIMTNYEKIKILLEMWVYKGVMVKTEWHRWNFKVESMNMYDDWSIAFIRWNELTMIYDPIELERYNITSITPIPNPPKLLPVGTKVRVFEEYSKDANLEYIVRLQKYDSYSLEESPGVNIQRIPARAVVPVLD